MLLSTQRDRFVAKGGDCLNVQLIRTTDLSGGEQTFENFSNFILSFIREKEKMNNHYQGYPDHSFPPFDPSTTNKNDKTAS